MAAVVVVVENDGRGGNRFIGIEQMKMLVCVWSEHRGHKHTKWMNENAEEAFLQEDSAKWNANVEWEWSAGDALE